MITEGVDYSFERPQPRALANAGKEFAVRYGGPGSDSKHLHAAELAALRAVGIDVVANAEGTAGGYTGAAAGRSWAESAEADFRALGMPADRPIYFSIDFDAGPNDWPGIDAALKASAAEIGLKRVGVYGSYDTMVHCRAAGLATWFWQTYAWSGGQQASWAHLYQYRNGVTIGGGDCDLTRALTADYGQWGYQEDDMSTVDLTPAALTAVAQSVATKLHADLVNKSSGLYADTLASEGRIVTTLRTQVSTLGTSLTAAIQALAAKDQVDEAALARTLVPGVVAGVLAALPEDRDDVTVEELTAAIRALIVPAA